MNEDGIYEVCDALGLRSNSPVGGSRGTNISISCPLAIVNHSDPDDWNGSCSVLVDDDGPSLVYAMLNACLEPICAGNDWLLM